MIMADESELDCVFFFTQHHQGQLGVERND